MPFGFGRVRALLTEGDNMLKHLYGLKRNIGVAVLMAGLIIGVVGCGSSDGVSPQIQSQKALKSGFSYMQKAISSSDNRTENLNNALVKINSSFELSPSQDALLLKAYILIGLDKLSEAHATLDDCDKQYPNSGADEHVRALLISKQQGDPALILQHLITSKDDNYSGIAEETWWKTIEQLPDFGYFRATPQYTALQALKPPAEPVAKTVDAAYVCKENVTKYEAHWYGSAVYLKEKDVTILDDALGLAKLITDIIGDALDEVAPGVGEALGEIFGLAKDAIKHEDKHSCGVILNIPWIPAFFVPTAQK